MTSSRVLAVIPARSGSKGLPGKNIRPFLGLPLVAHSILFARSCPEIDCLIVSTDSEEIAHVARRHGADVPFLRPADLAQDDTPLFPVLQHALEEMSSRLGAFGYVLLLDPTSPAREAADVSVALERLKAAPDADGVVSVSKPDFNPLWNCVVDDDGWMKDAFGGSTGIVRRQDAPSIYRINGALYIWRSAFVERSSAVWRQGRHVMVEIPELRAMSIDTLDEFKKAEVLVQAGLVEFSWMKSES
jgi:CMP-N,N'-diacetyllegionaminic acid synthase